MAGVAERVPFKRRLLTIKQFDRMIRTGIIREGDRVELIEGELVEMAAIGSAHAASVDGLNHRFVRSLPDSASVRVQNPIRLPPRSEPEPDIVIVRRRFDRYARAHPESEDIFLVIEVSDTTLAYDRGIKLALYAKAGIPEAWIVDLKRRRVLLFRGPADGRYREQLTVSEGTVSPLAFPELAIRIDDIIVSNRP